MSTPEEKRQYPRAEVEWPITFLTLQDKIAGNTKNISPEGLLISCKFVPASGDNLRIVIKGPGYRAMNIAGRVVWSRAINLTKRSPSYGLGIQFTEISENDSHFLQSIFLNNTARTTRSLMERK